MSEGAITAQPTPDLKFTVSFHRKVAVRQYESAEAFISIQGEVPVANADGVYLDELTLDSRIKDAFLTAKAHVYGQLGIPYEVTKGVLVELVKDVFPGATEVPTTGEANTTPPSVSAPQNGPVSGPAPSSNRGGGVTVTADLGRGKVALSSACKKCNGTQFWDNRGKKASGEWKANAPDFKCANRDCGNGVWA